MMARTDRMKELSPASRSPRIRGQNMTRRIEFPLRRRAIAVAISRFRRPHSALRFLIANPRLEPHLTPRKQTPEEFLIANFHRFFISSQQPAPRSPANASEARRSSANAGSARRSSAKAGPAFLIDRAYQLEIDLTPSRINTNDISSRRWIAVLRFVFLTGDLRFLCAPQVAARAISMLDFALQFPAKKFRAATADRWNFGLCATIPREPRQARKGATVTGQLRVPRITRSSSSRSRASRFTTQDSQ
jgi:hypothetical protein